MSFKNQTFKRTNVTIDGNLKVSGEINGGLIAQIQSAAAAIGQLQSNGFLGDLSVRGTLYEGLGSQWVGPIANSFLGQTIYDVAFGNLVYVAVGGNAPGIICRSTDFGATWSAGIANPFIGGDQCQKVAYGGGVFVAGGTTTGQVSRSTDYGVTWSAYINTPLSAGAGFIVSVAYGNGVWVIVNLNGEIARSTDGGLTWGSLITNPFLGQNIRDISFGNGVFVAVGQAGKIARSTDLGLTWGSLIANPFGGFNLFRVTFGNGVFLVSGGGGNLARSIDLGLTWGSLLTNPFGAINLLAISYSFGAFIVGSNTGLISRSYDNALTWGAILSNPFTSVQGFSSSDRNVVGVGTLGIIATAGWNAVFSSAPEQLYTPTFTNFGTVTAINFSWRRVGNRVVVMGKFTAGVVVAGEARISLPFGITSDAALIPSLMGCGSLYRGNLGAAAYYCLIESGAAYITFGLQSGAVGALGKQNGNAILNNAEVAAVSFEIPISGWNQ